MAGIEEAFEKFSDRLAREESKRYARDEQGDYVEEVQDPYPVKLGPLQLGANANISTGQYSPNKYDNVSTMNRNVGLRGKYNVPDSGIALLGSIGDVRSSQNVKTNLPFNPMTGEASPYSEMRKDVYKDSPYSVGAQYTPQGTDEMYSALYNKGGGYNLGYNKGPVNVSYTSNPGLGNNVMLRGQYNFADGGVASMFRERPGYAEGGNYYGTDRLGNSNFFPIYKDSLSNDYTTSIEGTKRNISPEEILSRYLSLGGGDSTSFNPANYNQMSNDYYSQNPQERYAEIPLVNLNNLLEYNNFFDPNTGNFKVGDFINRDTDYLSASAEERNPQQNVYYNSNEHNYNPKLLSNLINQGFNIPYVKDSNELVHDIRYLTNEDTGENEHYGITYSGKKVPLSQIDSFNPKNTSGSFSPFQYSSSNTQAPIGNSQGTPFTNQSQVDPFSNIPQVDPFTGDLTTQQDKLEFQMPQDMFLQENIFQQPSPVDQFIGERRFQAEADAAARSGIPFTKTKDDYFSDLGLTAYGKTAFDAFNQIGLTPAKQTLVNQALSSAPGIGRALLGEIGGGFKSIPGGVGLGEYVGQGLRSLGQAATLNNVNLGVNPAVGGGTLGSRVLGSLIGAPAIYATALFNPTTMGNAELTPAMRSQQEAAARVTPTRMAYGGRVSMSDGGLTTTIAPAKGPDSQGVESLFRRRYN